VAAAAIREAHPIHEGDAEMTASHRTESSSAARSESPDQHAGLVRSTRTRIRRGWSVSGAAAVAVLVGSLMTAPAHAAPPDAPLFCDVPGQELAIAPIDGLAEGQRVEWLSTTKGTTPTRFAGEYVGKLDNGLGFDAYGQPRDLLLVKLEGGVVDGTAGSPAAGVWAGASGSPVYDADGALIGAVSYGFSSLVADNVAGVTPAAYMKSIGDLPLRTTLSPTERREVAKATGMASTPTTMRQLTPVRVTLGTTAATLDRLSKRLAERVPGFTAPPASGLAIDGGSSDGADYPIVAGGNIAVSFAYGAVGAASVGTVTAVCGDDVFAFGHPNEWNSALGANIHGASAARIVPDATSYKLISAIGKVKGRLVDDRLAGIRGVLGSAAPTVKITTTTIAGSQKGTAVSHVSEKSLIAAASAAQLSSDTLRLLDNAWTGSARVKWTVTYQRENGTTGTLSSTNRYASAEMFSEFIGWELADKIALLQANPFEDVRIVDVKIRARFSDGYRAARLSKVQMRTGGTWKTIAGGSTIPATRGKTYTFRTVLSPLPGAARVTEYRTFTVAVPHNAKRTVRVNLAVPTVADFAAEPQTFEAYVAWLGTTQRSDVIERTRTYTRTSGSTYRGTAQMITPTVLEPGARFSFTLKAPAM
jgi:hypothetical protein